MHRRQLLKGVLAASTLSIPGISKAQSGQFDVVVIGAGVFGTWSAWYLCQAGLSVALIDQASPAHSASSSGGESRVTRTGYGDIPLYAEWSHRSLAAWQALSDEARLPLFHPLGMLMVHEPEDQYVKDSKTVLAKIGIPYEAFTSRQLRERYPIMQVSDEEMGMLEPQAGGLMARRGVQTLALKAAQAGVKILQGQVSPVRTADGEHGHLPAIQLLRGADTTLVQAEQFVFACGPWLDRVCPDAMASKLFVTRQEVFYFKATHSLTGDLPVWTTLPYYGLPDVEGRGFKVANDIHGPVVNPDKINRYVGEQAIAQTREFLASRFPRLASQPLLESRVCQYENSSNGDFVIDRHPGLDNVVVAGGGSGHGFKHGPAVGEYVTGLVTQSVSPIQRFSLASKAAVQHREVL